MSCRVFLQSLLFLFLFLVVAPSQASPLLSGPSEYEGRTTGRISCGDFNSDGHVDLLAVNGGNDPVLRLGLGNGVGGFFSWREIEVPFPPSVVVVRDWDGDGHLDAAVGSAAADLLFVLFGDGSASFRAGDPVAVRDPDRAATGDVNGDGFEDLVLGGGTRVSTLLGDGSGGFNLAFEMSGVSSDSLVLADVNGDRILDLMTPWSGISVFRGNGDGSFELDGNLGATGWTVHLDCADFDEDGNPDLIHLFDEQQTRHLAVYLGQGDGRLVTDERLGLELGVAISSSWPGTNEVVVGDLDVDGKLDLAVLGWRLLGTFCRRFITQPVFGLRGRGDGRFDFAEVRQFSGGIHSLTLSDLDADGRQDLICSGRTTVLLNDRKGLLAAIPGETVGVTPLNVAVGDFNGDGFPDAAVNNAGDRGCTGGGGVTVLLGEGEGTFAFRGELDPVYPALLPASVVDIDGDGHEDVLWGARGHGLDVAYGDGTGSFTETVRYPHLGAQRVPPADFDGDGQVDLVTYRDRWLFVAGGDRFLDREREIFVDPVPRALASGDVDQDGFHDIVASIDRTSEIFVLFGDGSGSFSPGPPLDTGLNEANGLTIGDLDGDGHTDLVVTGNPNFDRSHAALLRGMGARSFLPPLPILVESGHIIYDVAIADLDGNGQPELVSVTSAGLRVLEGPFDPSGSAAKVTRAALAPRSTGLAISDFDGDGHEDVGMTSSSIDRFVVHLNETFRTNPLLSPRGTVNLGAGALTDVVFLNGSAGVGPERRMELRRSDPLELRVDVPPAIRTGGTARFALYAWRGRPHRTDFRELPLAVGMTCMPIPVSGRDPRLKATWNNTGVERLGTSTFPSSPAPTVVLNLPALSMGPRRFFVQGMIADPGSRGLVSASVTNGIYVEVR